MENNEPLPLCPLGGAADKNDMKKCYACDEPTLGGLYCSCINHLPYGGIYASKELLESYKERREEWKSTTKKSSR